MKKSTFIAETKEHLIYGVEDNLEFIIFDESDDCPISVTAGSKEEYNSIVEQSKLLRDLQLKEHNARQLYDHLSDLTDLVKEINDLGQEIGRDTNVYLPKVETNINLQRDFLDIYESGIEVIENNYNKAEKIFMDNLLELQPEEEEEVEEEPKEEELSFKNSESLLEFLNLFLSDDDHE